MLGRADGASDWTTNPDLDSAADLQVWCAFICYSEFLCQQLWGILHVVPLLFLFLYPVYFCLTCQCLWDTVSWHSGASVCRMNTETHYLLLINISGLTQNTSLLTVKVMILIFFLNVYIMCDKDHTSWTIIWWRTSSKMHKTPNETKSTTEFDY